MGGKPAPLRNTSTRPRFHGMAPSTTTRHARVHREDLPRRSPELRAPGGPRVRRHRGRPATRLRLLLRFYRRPDGSAATGRRRGAVDSEQHSAANPSIRSSKRVEGRRRRGSAEHTPSWSSVRGPSISSSARGLQGGDPLWRVLSERGRPVRLFLSASSRSEVAAKMELEVAVRTPTRGPAERRSCRRRQRGGEAVGGAAGDEQSSSSPVLHGGGRQLPKQFCAREAAALLECSPV
jgi:hypothetical protein